MSCLLQKILHLDQALEHIHALVAFSSTESPPFPVFTNKLKPAQAVVFVEGLVTKTLDRGIIVFDAGYKLSK